MCANKLAHIEADFRVNHAEGNRVRRAEFIVDQFFGVEIVNTLIFAGITAVCETLSVGLEGVNDALPREPAKIDGSVEVSYVNSPGSALPERRLQRQTLL